EYERLGITRTWSSFYEYTGAVEDNGAAINICSFVGRGVLLICVRGAQARPPTPAELGEMRDLLGRAMDEGAIGLASGLIYPPSAYRNTDELSSPRDIG